MIRKWTSMCNRVSPCMFYTQRKKCAGVKIWILTNLVSISYKNDQIHTNIKHQFVLYLEIMKSSTQSSALKKDHLLCSLLPTCRFCGEIDHTRKHGCWPHPGPEPQRSSGSTQPDCTPSSPGQCGGSHVD